MYWTANLKRFLGLQSQPKLPMIYQEEDTEIKIRSVLSKNPAIDTDTSIVDAFVDAGEMVFFRCGEKIIEEGQTDDDVYLLVAGKVDIVFKRQLGSIREAPNQVGEMAAITPGSVRSANVIANSDEVAALKIPGHIFYQIWDSNPRFQKLLHVEMTARHRERIHAGDIAKRDNSLSWFLVSLGAGLCVGVVVWLVCRILDWTTSAQIVSALTATITTFVFMLVHNPAFFWKRCAGLVVFSIVGAAALDHFVMIDATGGFEELQVSLGTNPNPEGLVGTFYTNAGLLGALIVCALMDRRS